MAFYILTLTGKVVVQKDVWALTHDEVASLEVKAKLVSLDESICTKVGDDLRDNDLDDNLLGHLPQPPLDLFEDEDEALEPHDPDATQPEADNYTPESFDEYITAEVLLPHGGELQKARVTTQVKDQDGLPIG